MDIVLGHVHIWKLLCTFFAITCSSRDHDVMGEKNLLTKPIKFGVNGKRILCWSIFALEPITGTCQYLGYWPSKNASRDHGLQGEFVSLAKRIVLCTIRNITLCWSLFAIASIADFCIFWSYWLSRNGSVSLAKPFVFGTSGKRMLCWSIIAVEP